MEGLTSGAGRHRRCTVLLHTDTDWQGRCAGGLYALGLRSGLAGNGSVKIDNCVLSSGFPRACALKSLMLPRHARNSQPVSSNRSELGRGVWEGPRR